MSPWLALLLGLVQGLTEFLPVSSTGHLKLVQLLFGLDSLEEYLLFDLVCHGGTLLAIFVVLRRRILQLFQGEWLTWLLVALGTVPLFFLLPIRSSIEAIYGSPRLLGLFFLVTAAFLFAGERWGRVRPTTPVRQSVWAFIVGLAQLLAVFPGVSRSGTTISTARLLGWPQVEAANFSFLLAIPAISGGIILTGASHWLESSAQVEISVWSYFIGGLASFFSGWLALIWLFWLLKHVNLLPFAWYCLILGVVTLITLNQ
jgi:undecaprenyl-diphosphatase